ncbi:MAG TPA: hypothetical protein VL689_04320 [Paraburkholderia sp.]|jgi:hypothetical protein|nr:hypothetical protein [Paraburkholderia sp.]
MTNNALTDNPTASDEPGRRSGDDPARSERESPRDWIGKLREPIHASIVHFDPQGTSVPLSADDHWNAPA